MRQGQFPPVRVPASVKDLHRRLASSLKAMPGMAAATTERKINHPKPRLAAVTEEVIRPIIWALAITSYSFGVPERAGYSLGLGMALLNYRFRCWGFWQG